MSPHDALVAFAQDLVTEIASGMALELAAQTQGQTSTQPAPAAAPPQATRPRNPVLHGAAAVHPHLGAHLARVPGDTISGLAYQHLGMFPPGV